MWRDVRKANLRLKGVVKMRGKQPQLLPEYKIMFNVILARKSIKTRHILFNCEIDFKLIFSCNIDIPQSYYFDN